LTNILAKIGQGAAYLHTYAGEDFSKNLVNIYYVLHKLGFWYNLY
jgi:hypothetical protein